jgi:hypothetical protein
VAINYYHIAIPTPVIVEDKRATLHAVHYLFDARSEAELVEVFVYDGKWQIGNPWAVSVKGDHSNGLDPANGVEVDHDGINWGVGITLKFQGPIIPPQDPRPDPEIFFASFGADFYHNI